MGINNFQFKSFILTFLFFISLNIIVGMILLKKLNLTLNVYIIIINLIIALIFYYVYISLENGKIKKEYTGKFYQWSDINE